MRQPGLLISFIPVILLIALIVIGVTVFGADITGGASQVALLLAALTVIGISLFYLRIPWSRLEAGITDNLSKTGPAIFILLMIGALTSTWMLSGVVPTLIYYGMKLISPKIFLLVVFLLTAIVSVLSGSSWTTIGTIGVAMMSAGTMLGISEGWLAGAIISGAYFGDKRSPMSDTTNLASSVAGVSLYKNINYLLYTNMPSFIISGIVFTIVGFTYAPSSELDLSAQYASLSSAFVISPWLLLIPCLTIFMIYKKIPPFITLLVSALLSGIIAFFVQPELIAQICGDGRGFREFVYFLYQSMAADVTVSTGDPMLDTLACTSGMSGMLGTIWLILCVIVFGGVMEASGMIEALTARIISGLKSAVQLVSATVASGIFCNLVLSDQYMSIIVPGKMFAEAYRKRGYAPELLSRSLEDSATVTSVLVPWNTCGVVQSTVLGVATLTYLPYCIFNLLSPLMSITVAAIGWKIHRLSDNNQTNNNTNDNENQ